MMQRVMVSRCLLGEPARYDGSVYFHEHTVLRRWLAEGRVVSVCPEMAGGLPVPRPAAEINSALPPLTLPNGQTSARVVDAAGQDFTQVFVNGAEQMVSLSSGTSPSNTGTVRCGSMRAKCSVPRPSAARRCWAPQKNDFLRLK